MTNVRSKIRMESARTSAFDVIASDCFCPLSARTREITADRSAPGLR